MSERFMMPQNKREDLIFAIFCVVFMCMGMLTYNMILQMGFCWEAISMAWRLMPITMVVCFCLDYFFACKISGRIMRKIARPWMKPWQRVFCFQFFTVCQVAILESLYGEIMLAITDPTVGWECLSGPLWINWLCHIPVNFVVALPLMTCVCSPIVRFLFRLLFPVGKLQA